MSDHIKITMPEVSNTASQMRSLNAQLDDVLKNITNMMNDLSSVWQSEGAETIVAKFKTFANRFVIESETIEDYCKFLDLTVQSYDSLESTITANASNME
ncbi:MAG: pore-forming ESAT-6 family protein [Erysipelotrichaceae bacterium]|nr:pore-forming ESAT-6 family protein [Erysipelotrichaceae bacterium]